MIVIVEVADPSATTGVVPVIVEFAATGDPAVNVTVDPALTNGVAIERVLISALREVRVHVEIPAALEEEHAPLEFVVPVLVAVNVGTIPETALLEASFKVIVIVEEAVPSARTGVVPEIVEFAATADPAVNVTVPSDLTNGVAIDSVLTSATDELKVHVETPLESVNEQIP